MAGSQGAWKEISLGDRDRPPRSWWEVAFQPSGSRWRDTSEGWRLEGGATTGALVVAGGPWEADSGQERMEQRRNGQISLRKSRLCVRCKAKRGVRWPGAQRVRALVHKDNLVLEAKIKNSDPETLGQRHLRPQVDMLRLWGDTLEHVGWGTSPGTHQIGRQNHSHYIIQKLLPDSSLEPGTVWTKGHRPPSGKPSNTHVR